ncbi:hypothetical protein EI42_06324 [Thermosporothrix hazakensis]|jgi:hypothetical protein|uniref:Uncharacterized protein n=1 Tax=Thermosporothrix hazakensis TaxID=644383 RepID=A0A326TQ60_THEHA|nr:hypothetical protein [Thermosporothrix hazakensis]PZW18156.1 hypothetical protein EI42_06324 [Thermosporothrix hazakensis]GCE45142.1 hypothetical protein KTH_00110 [Thermosporothrix hazakensis]
MYDTLQIEISSLLQEKSGIYRDGSERESMPFIPGTFQYKRLSEDVEEKYRVPPLADPAVEATLSMEQEPEIAVVPVSEEVLGGIAVAKREAHERGIDAICQGYQWVGCGPLFPGLLREGGNTAYGKVLAQYGLTYERIRTTLPPPAFLM